MEKEEHDMLIRIDERVTDLITEHKKCNLEARITSLEQNRHRIEGAVALLIVLVGSRYILDIIYSVLYHKAT